MRRVIIAWRECEFESMNRQDEGPNIDAMLRHLGSGRDVYLIQLPREKEAAERHKHCAIRYWEEDARGSPRQRCTTLVEA